MKVLIPIDDSDASLRALDWAAQLQQESSSLEVIVFNARNLPDYYGGMGALDYEAIDRALREGQQHALARALEHARRVGLNNVHVQAAHGLPADEIVAMAKTKGVDQIVMGTHGRGAVGTFFLGSVAQQVVHLAPMPVTLVK